MRIVLVSAIALTLAACGQQPSGNESAAGAGKEASGGEGALKLSADGVPQFRKGAWEVTETSEGATETRKECLGDEGLANLREALTRDYPRDCKVEKTASGSGVRVKTACKQDSLTLETEIELTGSDTQAEMKLGTFVTTPDGKRDGGVSTSSARWVGECPAGAKPGEPIEG